MSSLRFMLAGWLLLLAMSGLLVGCGDGGGGSLAADDGPSADAPGDPYIPPGDDDVVDDSTDGSGDSGGGGSGGSDDGAGGSDPGSDPGQDGGGGAGGGEDPEGPVPEPSTILLISSGLAGIAYYRRRRRIGERA